MIDTALHGKEVRLLELLQCGVEFAAYGECHRYQLDLDRPKLPWTSACLWQHHVVDSGGTVTSLCDSAAS